MLLLVILAHLLGVGAQTLNCETLSGGCDQGTTYSAVIKSAIARFVLDNVYGGDSPLVFSSFLNGTVLASVSYSCLDGSTTPQVNGAFIQSA